MHIQRTEDLKDKESVWDLLKMLLYLCRPCKGTKTQQHSQTIAICKNYIFKNIYNPISVKQLAKFANVNSDYLSILFKKVGISLIEYIQRERVEEAKKLLTFTTYPLSDICASLNFSDQSYFTKIFKNSPMKHLVNTENLMLSFRVTLPLKQSVFSNLSMAN